MRIIAIDLKQQASVGASVAKEPQRSNNHDYGQKAAKFCRSN